jgi:hypothetical protein
MMIAQKARRLFPSEFVWICAAAWMAEISFGRLGAYVRYFAAFAFEKFFVSLRANL